MAVRHRRAVERRKAVRGRGAVGGSVPDVEFAVADLAFAALACAAFACAAFTSGCSSSTAPAVSDAGLSSMTFAHQSIDDVDVLFVIDDAPGMAPAQARLRASLASFADTLGLRAAGYPNLHVAVISSDLGAGLEDGPGCTVGGDRGVFWSVPRGACTTTGLPAGQHFFSVIGGQTNFDPTKSLADALSCVAVQDDAGCRFPHPLAAVLRALGADGKPAPPENAGFLRPGAFLQIVVVTNQDDCSAPVESEIFDPSSLRVDDPHGPLTSYRCAEYGVLCGGMAPSRTMAGTLSGCQSAEDGVLLRVSDVVSSLKSLKADPNMILVAALSGPPDPFTVELDPPGLADNPKPWPALAPSCTSGDGAVAARPGVRLEQWVYAFGHNGVLAQLCDDVGTSLQTVASGLAAVLGPACLEGAFAQKTGPHGARPDCTIADFAAAPSGADGGTDGGTDAGTGTPVPDGGTQAATGTPVPACVDTGNVAPCWRLTADAACGTGKLLGFLTPPGGPPVGLDSAVSCVVCDDPRDPRCR